MNNRLRDLPKTRALTTGFKLFTGFAAVFMAAAVVNGIESCKPDLDGWHYPPVVCAGEQGLLDSVLGPITFGWKGGIGDHFVYTVLVGFALAALFMAGFLTAFRDADPRSVAEAARTEVPPPVNPPSQVSFWPVLTVFSIAFLMIGLVANPATFVVGAISFGICVLMWTIRTWAEHATGANAVNEELRERVAFGLEVPLIAGLITGGVAMSVSRVLLAVDPTVAVAFAGVLAAVFFIGGVAFAYFPKISKNAIALVAMAAGVVIIGAGIAAAVIGERDFEHHVEDPTHEGAAPATEPTPADEAPSAESSN
jgi:hypothetical protein